MHLLISLPGTYVHAISETLVQKRDGKTMSRHALRDLRSLVLLSSSVSISVPALSRCADFGVPVHVLSGGGRPLVRFMGPLFVGTAKTRRASMRQKQTSVSALKLFNGSCFRV